MESDSKERIVFEVVEEEVCGCRFIRPKGSKDDPQLEQCVAHAILQAGNLLGNAGRRMLRNLQETMEIQQKNPFGQAGPGNN